MDMAGSSSSIIQRNGGGSSSSSSIQRNGGGSSSSIQRNGGNSSSSIESSIENSSVLDYKPGNGDDAWYLVSVTLRDAKFVIHYEGFPGKRDEIDLADLKSLEGLYSKFRYPSIQLNGKDCEEVVPNRFVSVAYPIPVSRQDGSISICTRYFDAHVVKVVRYEHNRSYSEEKCTCIFHIEWLFGPNAGRKNYVYSENIQLPVFRNIEKHPIFTEATRFIKAFPSSSSSIIKWSGVFYYRPVSRDDGWYLVSVTLCDGTLAIHYETSPGKRDELLDLTDLTCMWDLHSKFRFPSIQLKHEECEEVLPKRVVLVAYPLPVSRGDPPKEAATIPNGTQYFDAQVLKVVRSKHNTSHSEEKCMCLFDIEWLNGPNVGRKNSVYRENIHLHVFDSIEKHPMFTEAAQIIKDTNARKMIPEDHLVGPSNQRKRSSNQKKRSNIQRKRSNIVIAEDHLVGPGNERKRSNIGREEDHLVEPSNRRKSNIVIAEDKNGFIVCRIQEEID